MSSEETKRERKGLCCLRVVKSLSPPSLGLGTGSISFGLLRKHWKRRLESSGEDKGREEDFFLRAQGHTQSFSSPLRSEMGRKSLISHNLSHKSTQTRTLHSCRCTQRQEQICTCHRHTQFDSVTFPPA